MSKKNRESYSILKPDPYFSEKIATFGDRLCAAREDSQLSQKDLANKTNGKITVNRINEIENGKGVAPNGNEKNILFKLLGIKFK